MISATKTNSSFWRTRPVKKTLKSTFQANLKLLVLDEADAMTNLGFMEDLNKLFNEILSLRTVEHRFQAVLCSATLNAEVGGRKIRLNNRLINDWQCRIIVEYEDADENGCCSGGRLYDGDDIIAK